MSLPDRGGSCLKAFVTTPNATVLIESTPVRNVVKIIVAVLNMASLVGMIGGILLHSGRGGGLSDMFGGGGGAGMGSTAAERNLNRITTIFALIWIFTAVSLGLLLD
jgi:preprotein translocase subunit SecG